MWPHAGNATKTHCQSRSIGLQSCQQLASQTDPSHRKLSYLRHLHDKCRSGTPLNLTPPMGASEDDHSSDDNMGTAVHTMAENINVEGTLYYDEHQKQQLHETSEVNKLASPYKNNTSEGKINDVLTISSYESQAYSQNPNSASILTIPSISTIQSNLPVHRSDHPLDKNISQEDIRTIIDTAMKSNDTVICNVSGQRYNNITTSTFCDLISYNKPIRDSIIHQYLTILCDSYDHIYFLDTFFFQDLCQKDGNTLIICISLPKILATSIGGPKVSPLNMG